MNPKTIIETESQREVANRPMGRLNGIIKKISAIEKKKREKRTQKDR